MTHAEAVSWHVYLWQSVRETIDDNFIMKSHQVFDNKQFKPHISLRELLYYIWANTNQLKKKCVGMPTDMTNIENRQFMSPCQSLQQKSWSPEIGRAHV
jgi:hypothetical protein